MQTRIAPLAAMAFACVAPLQAGQAMDRIELICDASAPAECRALQEALAHRVPAVETVILSASEAPAEEALRIHLQIVNRAPDFVIARLVWTSPHGQAVTGPEVEVSTIDTVLNPGTRKALAQGLLQVSHLPI